MTTTPAADRLLEILRETIVGMVRSDRPEMTARQLSILLIVGVGTGSSARPGIRSVRVP